MKNAFLLCLAALTLAACGSGSADPSSPHQTGFTPTSSGSTEKTYTITWVNYDGDVLEVDEGVREGATPTFDSDDPTRDPDEYFTYMFEGWTPDIEPATKDQTYTATYLEQPIEDETVVTVVDDHIRLSIGETYGITPTVEPSDRLDLVTLKSENDRIVTVGDNFAIYGSSFGSTRVYFETPEGDKTYVTVDVYQADYNLGTKPFKITEEDDFGSVGRIKVQAAEISDISLSFDTPSVSEVGLTFSCTITKTFCAYTVEDKEMPRPMSFSYKVWRTRDNEISQGTLTTPAFLTGEDNALDFVFQIDESDFKNGFKADHYILQLMNY